MTPCRFAAVPLCKGDKYILPLGKGESRRRRQGVSHTGSLFRRARGRIPLAAVGFFLELERSKEGRGQVGGIVDLCLDREVLEVFVLDDVEPLRQDSVLAVGNTILAQISGAHVGRNDFQRAGRIGRGSCSRCSATAGTAAAATTSGAAFPLGDR